MNKMMKKVESMDTTERDKLRQLLREGKGEGSEEKMGWMYQGDKPEEEEYLLGRRIDRHVDDWQEKQDEAAKDAPGASFAEVVAKRADLDMQAKMREDPLYAIRKKEEEARRRLLENPIKMKQLEKMVDDKRAKEDKKKKKKKKHKHHHRDSECSSEDDELIQRYLAILESKKQGSVSSSDRSSSKPGRDLDKSRTKDSMKDRHSTGKHKNKEYRQKHKYDSSDSEGERGSRRKQRDSSSEEDTSRKKTIFNRHEQHKGRMDSGNDDNSHRHSKPYGLITSKSKEFLKSPYSTKKSPSRKRSRSPTRKRSRSPDRRRSRSPKERSRSPKYKTQRNPRSQQASKSPPRREAPKKKLTAEEKERRLKEMMADAQWRDDQRSKNVKRYNEEEKREEKQYMERTGSSSDFLNPMLVTHAAHSSVEDRIKRNKYNLQRTKADLDKAFTKR